VKLPAHGPDQGDVFIQETVFLDLIIGVLLNFLKSLLMEQRNDAGIGLFTD
jgi:hypothetical protein